MNKKEYIKPNLKAVRIQTMHMIANSGDTVKNIQTNLDEEDNLKLSNKGSSTVARGRSAWGDDEDIE